MRKNLVVIALVIALPFTAFAAERIVCLELFCRTACTYCPGAAIGVDELAENHPGEVLTVEYHLSDPFQNTESIIRALYYQDEPINIPCAIFDGVIKYLGPGAAENYESAFQTRAAIAAPLEIALENAPDAYMSGGTLTATIENTSEEPITGVVHFTVTESNIPYSWIHSKSWVHFCLRDMLPDGDGAQITLAAGADTTINRDYEINPFWPHRTDDTENIEFGCFVQDTAVYSGKLKEIFQAAVIPLENPLSITEEQVAETTFEVLTPIGPRVLCSFAPSGQKSQVSVFDVSGSKIDEIDVPQAGGVLSWPVTPDGQRPGIYFIVAEVDGNRQSEKVILVR